MNEIEQNIKNRTKNLAIEIIELVEQFPRNKPGDVIGRQLLRCATSVGANYRSACRAKSKADFISKLSIVEEEADEVIYWLDLIQSINLGNTSKVDTLLQEADELLSIIIASIRTLKKSLNG